MKSLKVGIAGYGIVGKRRHFFINEHPNLEVIAVCDQNFKKDVLKKDGVSFFSTTDELLNQDLDILFVCLTNNVAAQVTIAGLKKGLHVFCEKPPGRTLEDVQSVILVEKETYTR